MKKLGVILLNLGGPNSLDDVQPFLENLFLDPEIIDIPCGNLLRKPLARFISARRAEKVKAKYAEIGGKSPILERTREQAKALEEKLNEYYHDSVECIVEIGMRYWRPFTREAIDRFRNEDVTHVFLMPLYPQYSSTTSGSSFKEWKMLHNRVGGNSFRVYSIYSYHTHQMFIQSLNEQINEGLARFDIHSSEPIHILFSAHGTPVKVVQRGDPYSKHIGKTVETVMQHRGYDHPHHLGYQSKVGPAKWLEPDTEKKTEALGKKGVRRLLVVPVAFVSDHIETLYELDIELREHAARTGIREFHVAPALNDSPTFIECLHDLIVSKMDKRLMKEI